MTRRLAVLLLMAAMIVTSAALCFAVMYFIHGSLEAFPTDDDHWKVRIVMGLLAAILIAVEIVLWFLLRHLRRQSASPPVA